MPAAALAMQAVRVRSAAGGAGTGGGRGMFRMGGQLISTALAPGNEIYLAIIAVLLIAVAVLTALTIREIIRWRKK